jgi:hypothetical protein
VIRTVQRDGESGQQEHGQHAGVDQRRGVLRSIMLLRNPISLSTTSTGSAVAVTSAV